MRNSFGGSVVSQYDYRYDAIGRRTSVENSGSAFGSTKFTSWGYDERNQVTASNRYTGAFTATPNPANEIAGEGRGFDYDPIGNRETALDQDGTTSITYAANELNQYDLVGQQAPTYDLDGNLLNDGTKVLAYNAENQLVSVEVPGVSVSTFDYDYMGRRVRKSVDLTSGSDYVVTWVYSGWNKIEERKTVGATTTVKNFVWGMDLSQSMQGAGGVGGLIAVVGGAGSANLFSYDGNGNVSELIDASSGSVAAHYEYDAFGNVLVATGTAAADNAYRFSTKYADDETALVYYGYRYLEPTTGRWTQRDPAGTTGGLNPYALTQNAPGNYIEFLGLTPDTEAEVREAMRRAVDANRVTLADVLKLLRDFYTDGPAFLLFGQAIHEVVFEKYRTVHGLTNVLTDTTVAQVYRAMLRPGEHPTGTGGLRPDIVNLSTREIYEVKSVRGQVQAEQEAQAYAVALSKLCFNLGEANAGTWGSAVTANGIEVSWTWASPGVITYDFTAIPEPLLSPKPQTSSDDLPDWIQTVDKILILIPAIPKVRVAPMPGRGPVPVHGVPGGFVSPGGPDGA